MALVAPRALLITEGTEDYWSNPQGAGVSYRAAKTVYHFLGVSGRIGAAYRSGGHAMTLEDFQAMVDFCNVHFQRGKTARDFDAVPYPDEPAAVTWSAPLL
jgi:hypothetical protein